MISSMTTSTNLGIWMDHSNAHLMEFTTDPITTTIISSRFTHRDKEHSIGKSENGQSFFPSLDPSVFDF